MEHLFFLGKCLNYKNITENQSLYSSGILNIVLSGI